MTNIQGWAVFWNHGFHGYKKPKTIGCWYGYKKKIWWFLLLVWLQKQILMVSVVGMVTKQIFDGYGSWYGYHKHVIFGFQKPSMVPKNRSSLKNFESLEQLNWKNRPFSGPEWKSKKNQNTPKTTNLEIDIKKSLFSCTLQFLVHTCS